MSSELLELFPQELGRSYAWQDDALCAQVDPELFFPEQGGKSKAAKKVCAQCPVRDQCLDYALTEGIVEFGVFGGTTAAEREAMMEEGAA